MQALVFFDTARQALAQAAHLDEVKDLRDKAEALRLYTKQAGDSLEMQNLCAEIKLRAERRAGELLQERATDLHPVSRERILPEGISHIQSHRWQAIAALPEEDFEAYVVATKADGQELTSAGMYRLAQHQRQHAPVAPPPWPEGRYNVLLGDPPWRYEFAWTESRRIENHYSTLSLEEIMANPPPAMDDAILFLWATAPKLDEALQVLKAWGFTYRSNAVWVKDKVGMGFYFRSQHELLLVGLKGEFSPPPEAMRVSSVFDARRQAHSQKPESVYAMIEACYPGYAFLECFARAARPGWQSWGYQVDAMA